jgi:hypothetical protein
MLDEERSARGRDHPKRREADAPKTIAGARLDIAATRTQLTETVAELEQRLTDTVDDVKQKVDVVAMVKRNPWPALAMAFVAGVAFGGTGSDRKAARAAARAAKRAPETARRGAGSAVRAAAAGASQLASAAVERVRGSDDAKESGGIAATLKAQVRELGAEVRRGVDELGGYRQPPRR